MPPAYASDEPVLYCQLLPPSLSHVMPRKLHLLASLGLMLATATSLAAEPQLISDEQPPLLFSLPGQPAKGMLAEITSQLAAQAGSSPALQIVSYPQVIERLGAQPDLLYPLADKQLAAKLGLTLLGPLLRIRGEVFALSSQAARIQQLGAQMLGLSTVAESGSNGEIMAKQAGFRVYRVSDNDQAAKLVQSGRALLWSTDNLTASIQQQFAGGQRLSSVRTLYEYDLYLGFSRQSDSAQIERWRQALSNMKQDGSLQQLVQRWAPDYYPPQHIELLKY